MRIGLLEGERKVWKGYNDGWIDEPDVRWRRRFKVEVKVEVEVEGSGRVGRGRADSEVLVG